MFESLIVQPIFNLLVLITALIPGHNFGLAIIVFTVFVRLAMWPLVKKQLHHAKEMRLLQPEIKRIKKAAAGDRQKESLLMMELYKERNIRPFSTIGILIIQFMILLGLYFALRKMVNDPHSLVNFSFAPVQSLGWIKDLMGNINLFDETLFGLIDLTRPALSSTGWYIPGLLLVAGSAAAQYFQSVQLMPKPKDGRTLKVILKEASTGKQADQAEVSAAVMRGMRFFIPGMIFFFTLGLASALSLYWMTSGIVAIIQQGRILKQDEEEMEAIADEPEIISNKTTPRTTGSKNKKPKKASTKSTKKRK